MIFCLASEQVASAVYSIERVIASTNNNCLDEAIGRVSSSFLRRRAIRFSLSLENIESGEKGRENYACTCEKEREINRVGLSIVRSHDRAHARTRTRRPRCNALTSSYTVKRRANATVARCSLVASMHSRRSLPMRNKRREESVESVEWNSVCGGGPLHSYEMQVPSLRWNENDDGTGSALVRCEKVRFN